MPHGKKHKPDVNVPLTSSKPKPKVRMNPGTTKLGTGKTVGRIGGPGRATMRLKKSGRVTKEGYTTTGGGFTGKPSKKIPIESTVGSSTGRGKPGVYQKGKRVNMRSDLDARSSSSPATGPTQQHPM